ncbi:DUF5677 domain-containing protein [Peribacillus butanolivorans]|uniref:DUF5677 domain-containing protein n=1 Tax=Peribacillus butanolivorans TaxID=421767 RepID=UPI00366D5F9A
MKYLKKLKQEADSVTERVLENNFAINEKQFDIPDVAIIGLFEDMTGKINSLITLLDQKSFNGVDSLTRMTFENFVFLKFILQKDTVKRGKSYFYSLKIRQMKFFNDMSEQSLKGSEIRKYLSLTVEDLNKQFPELTDRSKIDEVEENFINSLNHKNIKAKWYNHNGKIGNFEILCNHLDLQRDYFLLYRTFSSEVHALEAMKYFKLERGTLEVYKKKVDIETNVNIASNLLLEIIREVYSYYNLKGDLKRFNNLMAINMKYIKR